MSVQVLGVVGFVAVLLFILALKALDIVDRRLGRNREPQMLAPGRWDTQRSGESPSEAVNRLAHRPEPDRGDNCVKHDTCREEEKP